jgi:hypothetical protein
MARRGRKPKAQEPKEFLINNDKKDNSRAGKKTNIFSPADRFYNIFPKGEKTIQLKPVKKGERLSHGKYRIEAHYPNSKSDDRDDYQKERMSKDAYFNNPLTTPSRIRYDSIGRSGYHLVTHDRDGKRVEFATYVVSMNGNDPVLQVIADMALPDKTRKRGRKPIMSCPVDVGKFTASKNTAPGTMTLKQDKAKAKCAKFGVKGDISPEEYETGYKAAEGESESFMSEDDLCYFYEAQGMEMDLSDYTAMDSVTVDDTSYQPAQNYGAEWMAEFCASCGNHKAAEGCGCMGAESDSATYEPSSEPDMVNEIATEPTNAEPDLFGSQGYNDKMDESMGMRDGTEATMEQSMKDRRDEASAMDKKHTKMGRKYDDVATMDAEGAYPSLEDFNGLESVVVEPPLGHGVAQWYAEGDSAVYEPSSEPDMESPATEPSNENPDLFGAESKNLWVKGKNGRTYVLRRKDGRMVTHNAESSPSSFDIRWEDVEGVSSPSLPPEGIHFAEGDSAVYEPSSEPEGSEPATEPTNENPDLFGADDGYAFWQSLDGYEPMDSVVVDETSYQPAQDYGSENFEGEFTDNVKQGAAWGMGGWLGIAGLMIGLGGIMELVGRRMGNGE